jgi:hypothetical protein
MKPALIAAPLLMTAMTLPAQAEFDLLLPKPGSRCHD